MKYILIALCIAVTYPLLDLSYTAFKADQARYKAEGACVAKLIPLGIERRDIWTKNGQCGVKHD